jgi:hypothetical protein
MTTTPLQDQLEADHRRLAENARANGLWEWFLSMVQTVNASFGPIIPPVIRPPASPMTRIRAWDDDGRPEYAD